MTKEEQSGGTTNNPIAEEAEKSETRKKLAKEVGGRDGPEPTRHGDWEHKGIASDF